MKYILNSSVCTSFGRYDYQPITPAEAREWASDGFTSTVGYEQTAEALTQLLGVPVPVDRRTIKMQPGDTALVFRLDFPAGTPRIDPGDKGRLSAALMAGCYELGLLGLLVGLDDVPVQQERGMIRVQFVIFPTREAAIAAGWLDAEFGTWQKSPGSTEMVDGWIALDCSD